MKARLKLLLTLCVLFPLSCFAAGIGPGYFNPISSVILWVTIIFFFAITGRYIAEMFHQPGVLGELLAGVIIGNVFYQLGMPLAVVLREGPITLSIFNDILNGFSIQSAVDSNISDPTQAAEFMHALKDEAGAGWLKVAYALDIFSRYGVIFLLFLVGLETSVDELKHTGKEAFKVAIIGVLAPILLGFLFMFFIMPASSYQADLFVAATLCATSVGITARVLKELDILQTREAKTILGAAMIDDILGLIVLAIVSSIIVSGAVNLLNISRIVILAVLFFTIALLIGPFILKKTLKIFKRLEPWEAKLFVAFLFVMFLSWTAELIQLATIIGAFAAGIILHEGFFSKRRSQFNRLTLAELVTPLEFILAPIFFVMMGIQVKIEMFWDWSVLVLACGLTTAAIAGKLVCGLGARRTDDRLMVGVGMLPRGEVGLIFASIGRKLDVLSDQLFAAIILMVIITTFVAPSFLKARFNKNHFNPIK